MANRTAPLRTYTGGHSRLAARLAESVHLYRFHSRDVAGQAAELIVRMREMEAAVVASLGRPLTDCDILEIGPGQKLPHMYYFARANRYTGADLDVVATRLTLASAWRMWQANGAERTLKTLGRHVLGIDRAFRAEMLRQLAMPAPSPRLLHMDATRLGLTSEAFDCTFAISVFEHLPDPAAVMAEMARVLRPGGVAYVVTHPFTSDTGIHDPRLFGERADLPWWSHLRPACADRVSRNCYLNELRLADYEELFAALWPGASHRRVANTTRAAAELARLRAAGELQEFSDDELMTDALVTVWRKP